MMIPIQGSRAGGMSLVELADSLDVPAEEFAQAILRVVGGKDG